MQCFAEAPPDGFQRRKGLVIVLTKTTNAFTAAHLQHLACTYDLINEAGAVHEACAQGEGAEGPDLPSQVSMASATVGPHREFAGQLGFTTSGSLVIGGIATRKAQRGVLYRWRRQMTGAADIMAPWRDSVDDALEDYVQCFRAQEGLCGESAQAEAMRSAAEECYRTHHGNVHERGVCGSGEHRANMLLKVP